MIFDDQDNNLVIQHDLGILQKSVSGHFCSGTERSQLVDGNIYIPHQNVSDIQFANLLRDYALTCESIVMRRQNVARISHIDAESIQLPGTSINTPITNWPTVDAEDMWVEYYNPGSLKIDGEVEDLIISNSIVGLKNSEMSTLKFRNLFLCTPIDRDKFLRLLVGRYGGIKNMFQQAYALDLSKCEHITIVFKYDRFDVRHAEYNPATHEYEYRPISSNPSIQRKYAQFRNRL